ncbi:nitroreductase [Dysgonomonas sp. 216]|uniref:nitroreductase family protein n=1 Tax=Dysgonomonas sp. 216 TaxID=2302934 RepID=UPI0013D3DCF0|nr:nitroreductase family protein [Dysgonomonas sp. 216]NDW19798.1 nitroreductase [Dysgonomonas sp. 216]
MNLVDISRKRYSVRAYLAQKVEPSKINYILECARLAPSACNMQPWFFYIIESEEAKGIVRRSYDREWFKTAPLYIVVCGDHSQSWKRNRFDNKDHCDVDVSIASEHLCLAVEDLGLGTCWVCNFDKNMLSEALNLPEHIEPIVLFPIGYVDEENSAVPEKKRKLLSEISKRL